MPKMEGKHPINYGGLLKTSNVKNSNYANIQGGCSQGGGGVGGGLGLLRVNFTVSIYKSVKGNNSQKSPV